MQATQASVDYWLENLSIFMMGQNSVTIYCKNGGGMDGDFSLVVTFTNASFSDRTALPYLKVDNSTVKVRFLLHKGESNNKQIYFLVNAIVREFSIRLTFEKTNLADALKGNPIYSNLLTSKWNATTNEFDVSAPQQ